ncbi:hypothetical protein Pcinc_001231 [Petrolisthes cinctipes]|uniref:Uncharacterized protein n=1 Tax=Petrolisthes cinctipes TaxID=88211 RepID=A0AAE1GKJ7_PETCI|nr:hypothetical protein Pcinc_001231 [Petrolisthes cinctipes]
MKLGDWKGSPTAKRKSLRQHQAFQWLQLSLLWLLLQQQQLCHQHQQLLSEYIVKTDKSHLVYVFLSIDVPDAEEEFTVEHSYSAQSPDSTSTTQPSSRPASCSVSRCGSATSKGAARGDEHELVSDILQVQKGIGDILENHLQNTASSLVSMAASLQEDHSSKDGFTLGNWRQVQSLILLLFTKQSNSI